MNRNEIILTNIATAMIAAAVGIMLAFAVSSGVNVLKVIWAKSAADEYWVSQLYTEGEDESWVSLRDEAGSGYVFSVGSAGAYAFGTLDSSRPVKVAVGNRYGQRCLVVFDQDKNRVAFTATSESGNLGEVASAGSFSLSGASEIEVVDLKTRVATNISATL